MESAPIAPLSLTAAKAAAASKPASGSGTPVAHTASSKPLSASQQYVAAVSYLTDGLWALKYPFSDKGGKPQRRYFFYGVDEVDGDCLYWHDSEKKKKDRDRCIPLDSVTSVLESTQTTAFKRAIADRRLEPMHLRQCFSIVGKKRTLDLQCTSEMERDRFISAFTCIMGYKQETRQQQANAAATVVSRRASVVLSPAGSNTGSPTTAARTINATAASIMPPIVQVAAPVVNTSSSHTPQPQRDMFVISVKARNLPVMPWCDDDSNDTIVCVYEKNARTSGQFQFIESSEWQLNNAMPNFRTPLLVPFTLPISKDDLIKLTCYDHAQDDAHVIGSVVVRAEFFMKNAGHEMMVKLKNSANPAVEQLLVDNNSYLLLTSTCKTQQKQSKTSVNPATKQQFGSVIQEFEHAIQNKRPAGPIATPAAAVPVAVQRRASVGPSVAAVAAPNAPQTAVPDSSAPKPAHARVRSIGEEVQRTERRRSGGSLHQRRDSGGASRASRGTSLGDTRQRGSSIQLPKTTLSFLQAGDSFTFYPPRRPIENALQPLTVGEPVSASIKLAMKGDYGTLVVQRVTDDDSDNEGDDTDDAVSRTLLSIPFELIYQAKIGTAPGCFHLASASQKKPKPSRCFSLLIKNSVAPDAKIAYWLDLECRSSGARSAWVAAITECVTYIHLPITKRVEKPLKPSERSQRSSVDISGAASPSSPGTPAEPTVFVKASSSESKTPVVIGEIKTDTSSAAVTPIPATGPTIARIDSASAAVPSLIAGVLVDVSHSKTVDASSSALSFLDPKPAKRSALEFARQAGHKLGSSNVVQNGELDALASARQKSVNEIKPAPADRKNAQLIVEGSEGVPVAPVVGDAAPPAPVLGDSADIPLAPPPPIAVDTSDSIDAPPIAPSLLAAPSAFSVSGGPRLRKLHWQAADASDELEGTLWSGADDGVDFPEPGTDFDPEAHRLLTQLFTLTHAKKPSKSQSEMAEQRRGIFDTKRAQNIEIALKSFRMPYSALHEAVLTMDLTILNVERTNTLIQCCPTNEELVALSGWETKQRLTTPAGEVDYTQLPAAEQFAFLMNSIPRYSWRLRSILFKLKFDDLTEACIKSLNKLTRTCTMLKESARFKKILRLILSIGNTLNRSTSKAFHLASLGALGQTKSSDGKTTLIDFIVQYVDRLNRQTGSANNEHNSRAMNCSSSNSGYLNELSSLVHSACLMDLNQLMADRSSILDGLTELQTELQSLTGDDSDNGSDGFVSVMNEFLDAALVKGESLRTSSESFTQSSRDLLAYLNEIGSLSLMEALECIDAFLAQFAASEAKFEAAKRESAKKTHHAHHRRQQTEPVIPAVSAVSLDQLVKSHAEKRRQDDEWDE